MGCACTRMADQSPESEVDNTLSIPSILRDRANPDRSFPTGVLIEILTRLPIKALVQCQLVCKEWQTLIQEDYFKQMHLDRCCDVVTHRYNCLTENNPNHRPNPDPFVYCHGCNGLLLIQKFKENKHYVWNPAIRRCLVLPDPHEPSIGFAFSYVPATKRYKIVSFYEGRGGSLACEVITPGDSVWRALELPEIRNKNSVVEREAVVLCGGAAHYVLVTAVGEFPRIDILSVDMEKESFKVSRFPRLSGEWKNYWELDWDGKLGFADVVGENLEVIVLEDYKSGRWCEKKIVIHLSFLNKSMVIPLFMEKGEICFWLKEEKIFKYTVENRRCTDCERECWLSLSFKVHPHKPSLIRLEGMVPDSPMFDRLRSCYQY